MPAVVVIGGPNGSGKTTLTSHLLQKGRIKTDVINPDNIALTEFGGYQFHIRFIKTYWFKLSLNNLSLQMLMMHD